MKNKTLIKDLRKQKGWTQENLAEKCNLSVRTIQRLESGEDGNLTTLNLVAKAFEVKIGDLFESIGNSSKEKDISDYSENQSEQVEQRRMVQKLYIIAILLFIAIMIGIAPFMKHFGFLWAIMWPIGFILLKISNDTWFNPLLDKKYPLTRGVNIKKYTKK
ncbi:XRE family transcriptional regulator [Apilactobacillus micheneri]|uniref:XRE family transcriptional regulator n=1 Tax=Apilactobacillus micheneri TaxID=1899430 RepID=A0ABY2Z3E0_9LACO|nr:helix-turn-helix transcriptional regulator [Apilactobacillus micheneri]TPR26441.1 XRE family transcriptional regulator [Apilactobacillus micheneri]TPR27195.1 XRE family transcriptional regulator [Apilactobacillus micheneri]TPR27442.1 XRE family transcriptional regulator [Apilactobacillus micheneri]TPR31958.1 XRE family transcriptional regulator [Apilactobacillus micheneri]TPR32362.1 XRE family transcriptional regulator [Apilactobacillus micheneri]